MKRILRILAKIVAKFYNWMPSKLKIAVMVAISFITAGFITQFSVDLTNFYPSNPYLNILKQGLLPLITIIINIIQQGGVSYGTKILSAQNDPATLQKLDNKIQETQAIKAL
jgi:hypothetical protein